jgi:hypothetical protein
VFWTHRANIKRLRAGEEHRFGKKGAPSGQQPPAIFAITLVIVFALFMAARFA